MRNGLRLRVQCAGYPLIYGVTIGSPFACFTRHFALLFDTTFIIITHLFPLSFLSPHISSPIHINSYGESNTTLSAWARWRTDTGAYDGCGCAFMRTQKHELGLLDFMDASLASGDSELHDYDEQGVCHEHRLEVRKPLMGLGRRLSIPPFWST
jgi:hypothetical protein